MANLVLQGVQTARNSFYISSDGLLQGMAMAEPDTHFRYRAGRIKKSDSNIYYGGLPITISVAAINSSISPTIELATTIDKINGFTIFNQSNNLMIVGNNDVQIMTGGGTINTVKLGSRVKLAVKCDPNLRTKIDGSVTDVKLSWDFNRNMLIEATGSATPLNVALHSIALSNSRVVSIENNEYKWRDGETCALIEL